ncbi:hypothetical protein RUND412_005984 [Rhizina undulata]
MFSNSQSTSLSNYSQRPFPRILILNNLNDQHIHPPKASQHDINFLRRRVEHGRDAGAALGHEVPVFLQTNRKESPGRKDHCHLRHRKYLDHNAVFLDGVKSELLLGLGLSSTGIGKDISGIQRGIERGRGSMLRIVKCCGVGC